MAAPRRRGVTLIELLLALGLLLAIGAFALPITLETLERRAFESAGDELVGQLLLARAHARESGLPVEVLCRREDLGSRFELDSAASSGSAFDSTGDAQSGGGRSSILIRTVDLSLDASESEESGEGGNAGTDDSDALTPLSLSWAERSYSVSIERVAAATRGGAGGDDPTSDLGGDATGDQADSLEPPPSRGRSYQRVALFVPDGSAPLAERLRLRDAAGREAFVTINPWTGLASLDVPPREASATEDEFDLAEEEKPESDDTGGSEVAPMPEPQPAPAAQPVAAPPSTPAPARPRRSSGRFGSEP